MPLSQAELVTQGKTLPVPDRLAMIRELAASLEAEDSFWLGDDRVQTLDRRTAELDAAPARGVPWSEVEQRLIAKVQAVGSAVRTLPPAELSPEWWAEPTLRFASAIAYHRELIEHYGQ